MIDPSYRNPIQVYMKRGWDEKRVAREVLRLMQWALSNRTLWKKRQLLYELCGRHIVPDDFTPADGREDSYGLMEDDDIWFWERYIRKNFKPKL